MKKAQLACFILLAVLALTASCLCWTHRTRSAIPAAAVAPAKQARAQPEDLRKMLVAQGITVIDPNTHTHGTAPAITITVKEGSYALETYSLPAVDGYCYSFGTMSAGVTYVLYKVSSNRPGHLAVRFNYSIYDGNGTASFDKLLPVYDQKPAKEKWAQDGAFLACAYLSHTTITY